ncbi:MAG: nucleotide sugar dehydrogenase [bacterium]|nr:nucleotide sugar dehydrogenase [bacterium]
MGLNTIKQKIDNKSLKVGVIGLGYVGLPLACEFAEADIEVIGFDIAQEKVDLINMGKSYIIDIKDQKIEKQVSRKKLSATTDFSALKEVDSISICVPTPLNKSKDPDISYIEAALESIIPNLKKGQIIILESTTYPGTTVEVIKPQLEKTGLIIGRDLFLAFSPERVDPGNKIYTTKNTPKVLGGVTKECTKTGALIYEQVINKIVTVSSPSSAEMVKLLENTFRSVNIGMANEIVLMCNKLGLNAWEIIEAAATKPFGFMPFFPGPGLGGHCIPIDPLYLSWKLKTLNYDAKFIGLADEINSSMPEYVTTKVTLGLNQHKKSINGSRILILGVAYKADINDVRESPALDIIMKLQKLGANIQYHDNFIPEVKLGDNTFYSQELSEENISKNDCLVIITHHSYFDIDYITKKARLIIDTRNATKNFNTDNIIRL